MASSILHTVVCLLLAILSIVERAAPCVAESEHRHESTQTAEANHTTAADADDLQEHSAAHPTGDSHHADSECQHCFCSCPCHIPALQPLLQELPRSYSVAVRFLSHAESPSDGVAEAPDHIPLT
ncbi:MAG: DUF2946 family protein [Armatimonadetes bacterium]|nr:DUF2946 family protein [Armatimonadota bacterium]